MSAVTRLVVMRSAFLRDVTETETSNLAQRSRKLFTLSALYAATKALLEGQEQETFERRVDLATQFWELVADQFPEWHQAYDREITAGEVRQDFIHTHGIVLHALGKVGRTLLDRKKTASSWTPTLHKLRTLDWHRSSPTWEGRAVIGGRVSKSSANLLLTTAAIRTALNLPLPPDEQRAEDAFQGGIK
jgi:DNA sulfur modification protein DndB